MTMFGNEEMDLPLLSATPTLGARAAEILRDAILRGAIQAGQTLRLDDLAQRFGISRIPLRDALRQLEKEGFVTVTPFRGARVLPVSIEEAREISEVSALLCKKALSAVFPRLTPAALDQTEALFHRRKQSAGPSEWRQLTAEMTDAFYGPSERPLLLSLIKSLNDQSQRYLPVAMKAYRAGGLPSVTFLDVIAACRQGDLHGAVKALENTHHFALQVLEAALAEKNGAAEESRP